MKKIFYSILLSGMMVLSACDALDLSPEDYYGSNDFWNQKSQVEMFINIRCLSHWESSEVRF